MAYTYIANEPGFTQQSSQNVSASDHMSCELSLRTLVSLSSVPFSATPCRKIRSYTAAEQSRCPLHFPFVALTSLQIAGVWSWHV